MALAYSSGTSSSIFDLMGVLQAFGTAHGWTAGYLDNTTDGKMAMHKDNVYVSFRWALGGTRTHIAMYQALGYSSGTLPGSQTDDSGTPEGTVPAGGTISDSIFETFRGLLDIGNGPYTQYHLFTDDGGTYDYIYLALEYQPGKYAHLGFGELEKFGNWTGGEFAYGHIARSTAANSKQEACFLDGVSTADGSAGSVGDTNRHRATMHIEGMQNQSGSGKWGYFSSSSLNPNDRAGNARVRLQGGYRGGPLASFMNYPSNLANGFVPMIPIQAWYVDFVPTVPELIYLGAMPNIRQMNIAGFEPNSTFSVGGQTWRVFPTSRKQFVSIAPESRNLGVAYRES